MSCRHAQSTTLTWLWGEHDGDHAVHVAGCETCQAVVAMHTDVVCAVAPQVEEIEERAASTTVDMRSRMLIAAALAAAVVLVFMSPRNAALQSPSEAPVQTMAAHDVALPEDDLDQWFTELDRDIDALAVDLSAL